MDILIHGRNVEVTPRLRSYVERKVERLDRYMPNIAEIRVDLAEEKARLGKNQIAQITVIHSRGTILRAEERTNDVFAAVDTVVDKMYRQIERFKGKKRRRNEGPSDEFAGYETAVQLEDDEFEPGTVIRRKQFSIEPMHEEEAIEQMDLLGHDFFVFVNAATSGVNVMYRRRDGNYGLLEPEIR